MSLPSTNKAPPPPQQSSIRSFFTPKAPNYAPPPSSASTAKAPIPPPPTAAATTTTTTLPPPPPAAAAQNTTTNGVATAAQAPAALPRPSNLHPQASISAIQPEHVPALRRITSLLLPVNYPDSFWARLSDPQSSGAFSRVVLWTDDPSSSSPSNPPKVVGGLVCRPETSPPSTPEGHQYLQPPDPNARLDSIYIQSLVLLSPYRGLGLAAALLDEVCRAARTYVPAPSPNPGPRLGPFDAVVWAHVWTDNADGLRWYVARGFTRDPHALQGYYFKLRPDSAWVVRKPLSPSPSSSSSAPTATVPPSVTAAAANLSAAGGTSYQNTRPETEWNDLPADMHAPPPRSASASTTNLDVPPAAAGSSGSAASSRSSSAAGRRKRERAYPAAAFGN